MTSLMRSTESWASHFVVSPIHSGSTENPLWTHPLRWMDAFADVPDNRASLKAIFPVYMQTHRSAENTFDSPICSNKRKKDVFFYEKEWSGFYYCFSFGVLYGIPRWCFEFSFKWDEIILISHLSKAAIVFLRCSHTNTDTHMHRHIHTDALLSHNAFLCHLLQLAGDSTIESLHSSAVAAAEVTSAALPACFQEVPFWRCQTIFSLFWFGHFKYMWATCKLR